MVSDAQEERPDPDALLARIKAEEPQQRGRLKIFLGFAAGVGKTYEMLSEANRRKQRGQDVVIGYVETHGRKGTEAQIGDLEIIPRKKIEYRGRVFEEMDTEAILRRKPQWVVVDELAHTNVPGSERPKRWQDVEYLRDHGISVLTTLNVQHLESLNDTVYDITGIRVRETVPDRLLHDAEIVMVDITPRALIHRLERGEIYPSDKIQSALNNWFREGNLNALREIALREVAQEVDRDLSDYRKEQRIKKTWATKDRIMVCIAPELASMRLLRRGWRIAQRLDADIVAVYVENRPLTPEQQEQFRSVLALADQLKIPVVTLHGEVADQLISYAKEHQITQIVIGHSSRSRFQEFLKGSIIHRLTQELRNIDILIVAPPEDEAL
ncbi:osmosensitive K+ channel His kinase sensor [Chthonomonas calidirosea]|uniref:universal stress protein n=1 Tax=Chthonomonas calidirosea TaxID=454171 RepID=UPI0006DD4C20|nr:universal stress protein [Chthonomonas calidirosea]CEK19515.1 osmosensitive K+ channel His kinase sensor [Chthonomonas calidirosea]